MKMRKKIFLMIACLFISGYISGPACGGESGRDISGTAAAHCGGIHSSARRKTGAVKPFHGCSSFYLRTPGFGVFGTNLDHSFKYGQLFANKRNVVKTGWEAGTTGKSARWTSKYGSLTFNLIGYQMAWAGMNEAGLVISTMQLLGKTKMPVPDQRPQLSGPFWVQYQLDNCATVNQVMAGDSRVRIAPNEQSHYLVCDKEGNCAVIEFLNGKTVYHTGRNLKVNALTNSIYEEALTAWRTKKKRVGESLFRFALVADELGKKQTFPDKQSLVDRAFRILSRVSRPDTAWSIVFANRELQVHFISRKNRRMRRIDLKKLDFSSETPVRMLDVHAALSGDISDRLAPYSHEAGFNQMRKAFHEFAPTIPDSSGDPAYSIECFDSPFPDAGRRQPRLSIRQHWRRQVLDAQL
jgi:hypothetical protein